MLPDAPDVERVARGPDGIFAGLRPGSVLLDMSTIDPGTTRALAREARAQGSDMVDSPVGKTADHAVSGTLTLMVGGDAADASRACGRSSTAWAPTSSTAAGSAPATR